MRYLPFASFVHCCAAATVEPPLSGRAYQFTVGVDAAVADADTVNTAVHTTAMVAVAASTTAPKRRISPSCCFGLDPASNARYPTNAHFKHSATF
jgi:hypothetical protein